jgi:hypothetical protein
MRWVGPWLVRARLVLATSGSGRFPFPMVLLYPLILGPLFLDKFGDLRHENVWATYSVTDPEPLVRDPDSSVINQKL